MLCAELAEACEGLPRPDQIFCDVAAVARPDAVTVELLARLSLTARHHGGQLVVVGAGRELHQLVELLGLRRALAFAPDPE